MNAIYKSVLLTGLGCFVLSSNAQTSKDTVLNKQVTVQRDYNPTIQDAAKINTTPAIYEPIVASKNLKFMDAAPRLQVNDKRLGESHTGDIDTDVKYDSRKGYLFFNAGNYINLDAAAGYRIVNAPADKLNIFAAYNSTDGKIDFLKKGYDLKKSKAKYAEGGVNLDYEHKFAPTVLRVDASYLNMNYNYYGNPFLLTQPSTILMDKKQNIDIFRLGTGLKSNINSASSIKYDAHLEYTYFKEKYGPSINDKGPKGGIIRSGADIRLAIDGDKSLGLDMYVMNQSGSNADYAINRKEAEHSITNTYAIPYFNIEGSNWHALLGVKTGYIFDKKNTLVIAPEVRASINLLDKNSIYMNLTGGINENTFLQILQENRYVNMMNRVGYSKTVYDLNAGFKLGSVDGFEFEVFAGYKQVNKDHLYVTNTYNSSYSWGNLSNATYANVSTGNFGALIKTNLIPYTNLQARLTGYNYNVKYKGGYLSSIEAGTPTQKKAWGRPTYTAEINADVVDLVPGFTLSMNYILAGGRKAYLGGESVSMKDINELNFRAEYRLFDWLAINARVNNVLFQKYEQVYGYAIQDFNMMGGISLRF